LFGIGIGEILVIIGWIVLTIIWAVRLESKVIQEVEARKADTLQIRASFTERASYLDKRLDERHLEIVRRLERIEIKQDKAANTNGT